MRISYQLSHRRRSQHRRALPIPAHDSVQSAFSCRRVVVLLFDATTCLLGFVSFDESASSFTYSCLLQRMAVLGLGGHRFNVQQLLHRLREWLFMCRQLLLPFHMQSYYMEVG